MGGKLASPLFVAVGILLLLSCGCTSAFKAEEFRKCQEASFCRRNRNKEAGSSNFALQGKLQQAKGGGFSGILINKDVPEVQFPLEISAYGPGIVRVKINEVPEKKRFEVPDVLVEDLETRKSPIVSARSSKDTWLTVGENKVRVLHDPLRVDAYVDGKLVLSINGRGLFNFEHHREKESNTTEEESGTWEEVFKSHTDSKPKGPASVAFDAAFIGAEHVYGIPERATRLSLKPTKGMEGAESEPYRLFNLDVFEYLHESPFGLYGAVPMMMSHGKQGSVGLFFLNAAEMFIDVLAEAKDPIAGLEDKSRIDTHWISESGIFDVFILLGPSPKQVVQQYIAVTGKPVMPPTFALAYHQCRWNYKDEADVDGVDAGFDEHDIPYDVLWLDIEHTDHKKYFTWDRSLFPNPKEMQQRIASKGRKMVSSGAS
jgi:alpha 1,3-glucosidase